MAHRRRPAAWLRGRPPHDVDELVITQRHGERRPRDLRPVGLGELFLDELDVALVQHERPVPQRHAPLGVGQELRHRLDATAPHRVVQRLRHRGDHGVARVLPAGVDVRRVHGFQYGLGHRRCQATAWPPGRFCAPCRTLGARGDLDARGAHTDPRRHLAPPRPASGLPLPALVVPPTGPTSWHPARPRWQARAARTLRRGVLGISLAFVDL